ncbi:MAG: fumarate hydratase [Candidatus Verstraetearchaeota archaeon]|nr:fumarate hydratase [Candidatus Verstraetearchaeota archaeon]
MKPEIIAEAIRILETDIPPDVEKALERALQSEGGLSRQVIAAMLENIRLAREGGVPVCQDTGSLVFFVRTDMGCRELFNAIREGVALATESVPLRANIVDPLSRRNTGNNLGRWNPVVHMEPSHDGRTRIGILAKGAGSENVSAAAMLDPDQGSDGIRSFVTKAVENAGAKPCPPIVVGVGVGGTLDGAVTLSKRALMRRLDELSPDERGKELEEKLLQEINSLGIGPMGFGGKTTALGVKAEFADCHTASLPVAVSIQCWALRRVVIEQEGAEAVIRRF